MEILFKKPQTHHAEEIARVCATGWKQTVEGILSEEYQRRNIEFWYNLERVKNDITNGNYTHIALNNHRVIGVIGGGIISKGIGEIFVFYIDENYRYQGIGRQLLSLFTEELVNQGVTEQWVSVQEGNEKGIPFYEARGFTFKEKMVNRTETGENQVSLRYFRRIDGMNL